MADAKEEIRAFEKLKSKRMIHEGAWDHYAMHVFPRKEFRVTRQPGEFRYRHVYDSQATRGLVRFASNMHGLLMNPAIKWFLLRARDERKAELPNVRAWMQDSTNRMFSVINSSALNFNNQAHEVLLEVGAFGTGAFFMRDEIERSGVLLASIPLKELYIDEDYRKRVNTGYRSFPMSVENVLRRWGKMPGAKIHSSIWEAAKKEPDKEIQILHCVREREDFSPYSIRKSKKFVSKWIDVDHAEVIVEGGFDEFPYIIGRWEKMSNDPYGRGPTETIFANALVANSMKRTQMRALQKQADPPMAAKHDDVIGTIRTAPGSIIKVRNMESFKILDQGGNPVLIHEFLELERKDIREGYFLDLFDLPELDRMTTVEINARLRRNMTVLAPQTSRTQTELLSGFVTRLFNIMFRSGVFLPLPDELRGEEFEIDFVSPISLAQKASEIDNRIQFFNSIAPFLEVDPTLLNVNMDLDSMTRSIARLVNLPESDLHPDAEAQARREQLQQAQAQASMAQTAQMGAAAAKDGAKAAQDLGV